MKYIVVKKNNVEWDMVLFAFKDIRDRTFGKKILIKVGLDLSVVTKLRHPSLGPSPRFLPSHAGRTRPVCKGRTSARGNWHESFYVVAALVTGQELSAAPEPEDLLKMFR